MAHQPASEDENRKDRDYVTIAEFAAHFRVTKMTVGRKIHSGKVEAIPVGRRWRIPVAEFERCKRDGF